MYDPTIGRFISEDPIRIAAGDTNYYRYVGNNPTNKVDPTGLYEEDIHFYMTYFLARAIGLGDIKSDLKMSDGKTNATDAYLIAWAAQYTDVHSKTQPVTLGQEQRYKYHFRHKSGELTKAGSVCATEPITAGIKAKVPLLTGIGAHAYEDSYAHAGYDLNHIKNLSVDRPHTDPTKAMAMAKSMYEKLAEYYKQKTGNAPKMTFGELSAELEKRFKANETQEQANKAWRELIKKSFAEAINNPASDDKHPWSKPFLEAAGKVNNPK